MKDSKMSKLLLVFMTIITILITIFIKEFVLSRMITIDNNIIITYVSFIVSYVICMPIFPIIVKVAEIIYLKSNQQKLDNFEFDYYRDIINKYSIGTLCHCYGKKIKYEDQIAATLLRLELNGKIRIKDDHIDVLNEDFLSHSELMIIRSLKGTKVFLPKYLKSQIREDSLKDCKNSDLFYHDKESTTEKIASGWIMSAIILWVINYIVPWFWAYFEITDDKSLSLMFLGSFIILPCLMIFSSLFNRTILIRNERGVEIQQKLIGLKNYLKEYSIINKRKIEDINIWNYYIIYAIIFDLKGELDEDAYNLYLKYLQYID